MSFLGDRRQRESSLSGDVPSREDPHTAVGRRFSDAAAAHPSLVHERCYIWGGRVVRVRTVGHALADLIERPFAHLRAASGSPACTIELWDEGETGVRGPVELCEGREDSAWEVGGGVFTSAAAGRTIAYHLGPSHFWLDRAGPRIAGWTACGDGLRLFDRAKPLHFLLTVWLGDGGVQLIHAGLVAEGNRGVLLPGASAAGKTTTALACLSGGLAFLGDDHVGLELSADGDFIGHSLYASARLHPTDLSRFNLAADCVVPPRLPREPKALVFLEEIFPKRLVGAVPIRVLAFPRIVDAARCSVRRASKRDALMEFLPSSVLAMTPRPGRLAVERLARLVETVPSYWLDMGGNDPDDAARCVREILREVDLP